jgi:general stress protein 26
MQATDSDEGIRKIGELIKEIRITMLVTIDADGRPRSRPMSMQDAAFDGRVWFLTNQESAMVREILANPIVNLGYASPAKETFVSLTGRGQVLDDRVLVHDFWNPLYNAWFDGPDDPNICVIRVDVETAEYWDTRGGKAASILSVVAAAFTGNRSAGRSEHNTVEIA